MGKHTTNLLQFARRNPGWHSIAKDVTSRNALKSLIKRGYLEYNQYGQFRLKRVKNIQHAYYYRHGDNWKVYIEHPCGKLWNALDVHLTDTVAIDKWLESLGYRVITKEQSYERK